MPYFSITAVHTLPESCLVFFNYFFKFCLYTHGQLRMYMEEI